MLNLNQVFNKKDVKFTKSQLTNSLYKYGHITKEQKDYLDSVDKAEEMCKKKGFD